MENTKQLALFEENTGILEIKKHSSLVQMNNVTTLQQKKAINALIRVAKDQLKRDPDRRVFEIDLALLKKLS